MTDEKRVEVERINVATDKVTGVGTARMRGATFDDYRTTYGGELKLRPGERFVIIVRESL